MTSSFTWTTGSMVPGFYIPATVVATFSASYGPYSTPSGRTITTTAPLSYKTAAELFEEASRNIEQLVISDDEIVVLRAEDQPWDERVLEIDRLIIKVETRLRDRFPNWKGFVLFLPKDFGMQLMKDDYARALYDGLKERFEDDE